MARIELFFSGKVFGKQQSKSSTSVSLDVMHHCNCWFHAGHQLSSNFLDVIASEWKKKKKNIFPILLSLSQPAASTSAPVESWCCKCLGNVGRWGSLQTAKRQTTYGHKVMLHSWMSSHLHQNLNEVFLLLEQDPELKRTSTRQLFSALINQVFTSSPRQKWPTDTVRDWLVNNKLVISLKS